MREWRRQGTFVNPRLIMKRPEPMAPSCTMVLPGHAYSTWMRGTIAEICVVSSVLKKGTYARGIMTEVGLKMEGRFSSS